MPTFAAPYARRTLRLNEALRLIGLVTGGEAGSRLPTALGMNASPDTIIERIRKIRLCCKKRMSRINDSRLSRS
jgi:hypothetical protein